MPVARPLSPPALARSSSRVQRASRGGGSSSAADAEGARSSSSGDAFVGTPRDLARMALYGLSCMLCRLKMRYIPFVAAAHDQVLEACLWRSHVGLVVKIGSIGR